MAINLNDFIGILKREGRYGLPATLGDQATTDILNSVNVRLARIWGAADWKWQREVLAFQVGPGVIQYGVLAKSGNPIDRILDLIPNDPAVAPPVSGRPLEEMEIGDFYEKCSQVNVLPDLPSKYINIGQNSSGIWQIILWPSPSSSFTMAGYAKAILYTYLAADVVANTPIGYFPNGVVLDALMAGCLIDIGRIQGMTPETALAAEAAWEMKIKHLIGDQIGVATDNTPKTAPMPDRIVRRMLHRNRRGIRVH